jgi:sodium-dependent dicarboxylate transporter 2/3/5
MTAAARAPDNRLLSPARMIGLVLGVVLLLLTLVLPPPPGLSQAGWLTLGLAGLMASWWASEAIPIYATALIPLVALPLLGVSGMTGAAAPYANPLVFLFLGGFLIAEAMQRWNLHRRIALLIAVRLAASARGLVLGFMIAAAFLSMWVSNTATTLMMLPIAMSVMAMMTRNEPEGSEAARRFGLCLLLGIAYGASIGGVATLIGTPPNALMAGFFAQQYDIEISFANWMLMALPVTIVFLPIGWLALTRLVYPVTIKGSGTESLRENLRTLGPMAVAEKRVLAVFVTAAALWMLRPLIIDFTGFDEITDTGIAIACGLALFLTPAGGRERRFLMIWEDAQRLPWGVLVLFGGGLSLAAAIGGTDLAQWLGGGLEILKGAPAVLFILAVAGLVLLLTELTSNTATVAALLPVIAALALATDVAPIALAAPAVMAASCAFMLPVATPPNAIVFASGAITIPDMVRAGVVMNIIGLVLVTLAGWLIAPLVFG